MATLADPTLPTLSVTVHVCVPESVALRKSVDMEGVFPRTKHSPEHVEVHSYISAPTTPEVMSD